jgi:hypothetical protein
VRSIGLSDNPGGVQRGARGDQLIGHLISLAVAASWSSDWATTATEQPAFANPKAITLPIPLPPPVTMATCPVRGFFEWLLLVLGNGGKLGFRHTDVGIWC